MLNRGRLKAAFLLLSITLLAAGSASAQIAVDVSSSKDQGSASTTVATASFSTASPNELLLAFVSTDDVSSTNTTVTNVAGGGLTWNLVKRTNTQKGTAEIWSAFASSTLSAVTVTATLSQKVDSSLTVMSFRGVNTSGAIGAVGTASASSGAPSASLVTTGSNSVVLGVGNDWDNAISRTVGSGQKLVHQYLAPVGDTYWVQMLSQPVLLSGTTATINDTAPTGDRYNLSIVEVLASPGGATSGSITGAITPASSANGATVALSQNGTTVATATVGSGGTYSFSNVNNGTYLLTPTEAGFTFSPSSESVTVASNAVTAPTFTALATTGSITGAITPATNANGATVILSQNGSTVATATVGTNGSYSFSSVPNGTYTLTPSDAGFTFSPASENVTVAGNSVTAPAFTISAIGSISGAISPAPTGSATVALSQNGSTIATATVGTNGSYLFSNVVNGTYLLTPAETGFTFSPASESVTVASNAVSAPTFTASPVGSVTGTITPATNASGTTVTLSQNGTTIATATVGTSGSYTFNNVSAGTYLLTPNDAGFTFSPSSESVTVAGSPVTAPPFTITAIGSITGAITPVSNASGAVVTLSQNGTTVATASVGTQGTFTFSNVVNGTYLLTPSEAGFTFSPANESVTVASNSVTAPTFSAAPVGTGVPQHVQSCTPANQIGGGTQTITKITCNNVGADLLVVGVAYECCNRLSDMTVSDGLNAFVATPAGKPNPGSPVPSCFANGGAQVGSVFYFNYNSAPGNVTITVTLQANEGVTAFADEFSGASIFDTDACGTSDSGTTINSPSLTPTAANEVQYAVCAAGGNIPVGGTAPWTQGPLATGDDVEWLITTGANPQAPVFGAQTGGTGWACVNAAFKAPAGGGGSTGSITGSITPTASANGATVVLSQNGTTVATTTVGTSGTYTFSSVVNGTYTVTPSETGFSFSPATQNVTVNGGPASVPAFTISALTYSVTGSITPAASANGATVVLSQNGTTVATATAGTSGTYTFNNIANGTYTVTPSETGFSFSPTTQNVTVNGGPATVPAFTISALTYSVTGSITPAASANGATVVLSQNGTTVATATAGTSGTYTFSNIANGTYTVTPSETGFSFSPTTQNVTVNGGPATVPAFTISVAGSTFSIAGAITPAATAAGSTLTLTQNGATVATTTADSSGNYSFGNLAGGAYTITPTKASVVFSPNYQTWTVNGGNVTANAFTATSYTGTLEYPDLSDIIPTSDISVVGSGSTATFQYTHDTYNGGPGPLVIQPAYNSASGTYQGTQYIYSLSGSTWTMVQTIRVAGAFIFDAAHGHFHYPFTTYGLYTVGANGGPGTPVATSGKISFCINDSFIYNSSLPHSGALGNLGSCSDPTSLRGLDIGAVDEYDQTDDGQSISIAGVPNGTYWLRAIVDPDDYLAEASKANNETDVELTINGNSVQILQTVTPVLPAPPNISINSPTDGSSLSGSVSLTASAETSNSVQFLIDGTPLGSAISAAPFTMTWDTTTATNGSHWLAAQTTGPSGVIGTSWVVAATVANLSGTPPSVQITTPDPGETVSATVTVAANVASSTGIASVTFYVDGTAVGSPLTAPPYLTIWDTETSTAGQHTITATAIDVTGNSGTSAPVTVTVDNSQPPNVISIDAKVSVDGSGSMTAPVITTSQNGELVLAFVSYDGPQGTAQTATVTGSGRTWTLVKRSNHQSGTAEIWMTYASDAPESISATAQPGSGGSYHGSMTVIAFINASGPGIINQMSAPTGAPDIYLPGISAGNWVFAVGNDWDNAIARTPVSGQVLVHQRVDTAVGDTYWVQSTAAPSTATGLVDIHDSAPTTDQWNYAAVEVVATR